MKASIFDSSDAILSSFDSSDAAFPHLIQLMPENCVCAPTCCSKAVSMPLMITRGKTPSILRKTDTL